MILSSVGSLSYVHFAVSACSTASHTCILGSHSIHYKQWWCTIHTDFSSLKVDQSYFNTRQSWLLTTCNWYWLNMAHLPLLTSCHQWILSTPHAASPDSQESYHFHSSKRESKFALAGVEYTHRGKEGDGHTHTPWHACVSSHSSTVARRPGTQWHEEEEDVPDSVHANTYIPHSLWKYQYNIPCYVAAYSIPSLDMKPSFVQTLANTQSL